MSRSVDHQSSGLASRKSPQGRIEMSLILGGMLVVLACLAPKSAAAGVIHGVLRVSNRPLASAAMSPYPGSAGSMAGMHTTTIGLASDAVIYIEDVPAEVDFRLAATATEKPQLAQKGQSFVPRVLAIAAGTAVAFPNLDPIYHNVFSLSPARRFDLGKYPRGSSREVVFPNPGLVKVYCDIHSNMEAFVFVLPHHAFVRPTSSGEFVFPDLPMGRYVAHAWHPDLGDQTATVEVPERGRVAVSLGY